MLIINQQNRQFAGRGYKSHLVSFEDSRTRESVFIFLPKASCLIPRGLTQNKTKLSKQTIFQVTSFLKHFISASHISIRARPYRQILPLSDITIQTSLLLKLALISHQHYYLPTPMISQTIEFADTCIDTFEFSLRQIDSFEGFLTQPVPFNHNNSVFVSHMNQIQEENGQLCSSFHPINPFSLQSLQMNEPQNTFSLSAVNSLAVNEKQAQGILELSEDDENDFMNFFGHSVAHATDYSFHQNLINLQGNQNSSLSQVKAFSTDYLAADNQYFNQDQPSLGETQEQQLLRLSDFDQMLPEMEFDPFSEDEFQQSQDRNQKNEELGKLGLKDKYGGQYRKIVQKVINKQKRRDYDKNICRYIARQIMRCFVSQDYYEIVIEKFSENNETLSEASIEFVRERIKLISGHRTFKDLLSVSLDDTQLVKDTKKVFQKFAKWFLKERSLRYIMLGNSEDKIQYIRFKNQVMLHFIDQPEKWNANLKINPTPFRVRRHVPFAQTLEGIEAKSEQGSHQYPQSPTLF